MRSVSLVLVVALSLQGCVQTIAIRTVGGIMDTDSRLSMKRATSRSPRTGLSGNLKLLEALIKGDPENEKLLLFAAQGYSAYAMAFVEDDSVERARPLYLRARAYAFRVLEQRAGFRAALEGDLDGLRAAVSELPGTMCPRSSGQHFPGGYTSISAVGPDRHGGSF